MKNLRDKIQKKKACIAVMGLGYVGLPLAVSFAKKGFKVYGLDNSGPRVSRIRDGKNYNEDVSIPDIAKLIKKKILEVSDNFSWLSKADVILICVPTPLKRRYTPDITYITKAVKTLRKYLRPDTLVILESTTYPGTTEELIKPELEKSGLVAGKDFYLAFSPERIDPGNKRYPVTKIPKIVGGIGKISSSLSKLLYQKIIKSVHAVSSPRAAEMTKLLENSFRLINISWVNELAMMCDKLHIDIWEVIEAAKTKPFGFMPFYPSLGVGGHCIPDDPLYLFWKARHHGISSKFIKLSADTNDKIPLYVLGRLEDFLKSNKKKVKGAKILMIGVTYKKDVKDLRRSASLKFLELLKGRKYHISYFDPLIPYLKMNTLNIKSSVLSPKVLENVDCAILAVKHSALDYEKILKYCPLIFDLCNAYKGQKSKKIVAL